VTKVLKLTNDNGAEAVVDFVAEGGSTATRIKMLRRAGNYYVVGYGENINVPTIDIISTEINFVGNLIGSYNDLAELIVLAAQGRSSCIRASIGLRVSRRLLMILRLGRLIPDQYTPCPAIATRHYQARHESFTQVVQTSSSKSTRDCLRSAMTNSSKTPPSYSPTCPMRALRLSVRS